jgi:hypothetical protein
MYTHMGKSKYKNPNKTKSNYRTQATKGRRIRTTPRTKSKKNKKPFIFDFIQDTYCYHIPDNYINAAEYQEDAEIKQKFIDDLHRNGFSRKPDFNVERLNNICKAEQGLTRNLQMQTGNNIILYVEKDGDIKAATTIDFDFYTSEDRFFENISDAEGAEDEEIPWSIKKFKILTFCSKERGYGRELMTKLKTIFIVGIDNGYVLDKAQIVLNYTPTSKSFYEKLGFKCEDIHGNKWCVFADTYQNK